MESDGRYFPRSDKVVAVRDAFLRALNKAGCQPLYNCNVNRISRLSEQNKFAITAQTSQTSETFIADAVILATGAPCYPETGSDGWGLRMAASLGLNVNPSTPALTRIPLKERWPKTLSGVTLSDCELSIKLKDSSKIIETERGELLFTQTGLSGPTALNFISLVSRRQHPCP